MAGVVHRLRWTPLWLVVAVCTFLQSARSEAPVHTTLLSGGDAVQVPHNLGAAPYLCVGDINYCPRGFSLSFLYTPGPGNRQQPAQYILSSGGQSPMSDGVYFRRHYGMEYEGAVSRGNTTWVVKFYLRDGIESHVALTWGDGALHAYVDGKHVEEDAAGKWRVYTDPPYDPYPEMWIGKANDDTGNVHDQQPRDMAIRDVQHVDTVYTQQQLYDLLDDSIFFRSCSSTLEGGLSDEVTMTSNNPVKECRQHCAAPQDPEYILAVTKTTVCSCWSPSEDRLAALPHSDPNVPCAAGEAAIYWVTTARDDDDVVYPINFSYQIVYPTNKGYTRPEETITFVFEVDTEEDVVYEGDFGDGTAFSTLDDQASHAYAETGSYTIVLRAITRTNQEELSQELNITWVDEGVAPELVLIKSSLQHKERGDGAVDLYLTAISHDLVTCHVDLGDGNMQSYEDMDGFINQQLLHHQYHSPGYYDVSASCENQFGTRDTEIQILAANEVVERQTEEIGTDIDMLLNDAQDNLDTFQVHVNNEYVENAVIQSDNVTIPGSTFDYSGQHIVELKARGIPLVRRVVKVQKAIASVAIEAANDYSEVGQGLEITFKIWGGDYINAQIDLGDGTLRMMYIQQGGDPFVKTITHVYNDLGDHVVQLQAANDINYQQTVRTFSIQRPLFDAELSVSKVDVLGEATEFLITTSGSEGNPVVPISVTFRYGDGVEETVTLGSLDDPSAPLVHRYVYAEYGWYDTEASVHNDLGSRVLTVRHQIGSDLGLVDVAVDKPVARVDEEVSVFVNSPFGSPSHIEVNFGDGSPNAVVNVPGEYEHEENDDVVTEATVQEKRRKKREVNTGDDVEAGDEQTTSAPSLAERESEDAAPTMQTDAEEEQQANNGVPVMASYSDANDVIVVKHRYSQPGQYPIRVSVSNPFSNTESELCPDVQILPAETTQPQCENFVVTVDQATDLANPMVFNRSSSITFNLHTEHDCGDLNTVVDYTWSAQRFTEDNQLRPELEVCHPPTLDESFTISGNTMWYGTYKLTVRARIRLIETVDVESRRKRATNGELVDENALDGSDATLTTTETAVYVKSVPSELQAILTGGAERQITVSQTPTFNVSLSNDPDVVNNKNRTGMTLSLICYAASYEETVNSKSINELLSQSEQITNTSVQHLTLYEYNGCFKDEEREKLGKYVKAIGHQVIIGQASLFKTGEVLHFRLFVEKDDRIAVVTQRVNVLVSDDTDDLLNNIDDLLNNGNTGAALAVIGMVTDKLSEGNSTDPDAANARTEVRTKLIGALDTVSSNIEDTDQLMLTTGVLQDVTQVEDEVTMDSKATAASALNNSAAVTGAVAEDADVELVTGVTNDMVLAAGNVMPMAETPTLSGDESAATTASPYGDTTHVNVIVTERGEIIATRTINGAGTVTTLPGIVDVTPTASMAEFTNTTNAPVTEKAGDDVTTEHAVTYVTVTGETGTFTGTPMTMTADIFALPFSGASSPAVKATRATDATAVYTTAEAITSAPTTTVGYDVTTEGGGYWGLYDAIMPDEEEEKCCERANGLCEWIEPECPYLDEADRKKVAWDNHTCFEIHPDDMKEIMDRFDLYKKAMKNLLYKVRKSTTTCAMKAMDEVGGVLLQKSDKNSNITLDTPKIKFSVETNEPGEPGTSRPVSGTEVPANEMTTRGATGTKSLELANPYTYSDTASQVKSKVKSISLAGPNGTDLTVQNATDPFVIWLPGPGGKLPPPSNFSFLTSTDEVTINYHPINLTTNSSVLYSTIIPDGPDDIYEVFVKKGDFPNATYYDYVTRLPHDASDVPEGIEDPQLYRYTVTPPQNLTALNDTYYIGVRIVESKVNYLDAGSANNFSYTIQNFITGCLFWNEDDDNWSSDGCLVGPLTTSNATQCLCDHMTSFGSDFVVPPNTIDFSTVFSLENFLEALPVFITVGLILLLYVALLVWARRADKKDLLKWGATPLEDNLPTDMYHYQITVNTGVRKGAGTKSKINFILSGDEGDTGVRRLYDGKRKEHPNGSIYNYILSTECCLGPLTYLRIWHDNSGRGKKRSWFLDQVCVADLQTGDRNFFLCNRWLAVEEDDGMVDRILPVAGTEDLTSFKHLFSSSVRKKLTNDHLWVSIFSRPTKSTFTRVQRISCCVCLLFLTMITNCMFFRGPDEQEENVEALNIGPLSFTMQQLFISVVSTCIVFPPSLFVVTIFKKVKPKKNAVMHANQSLSKKFKWRSISPGSSLWTNQQEKSRLDKLKESINNILSSHHRAKYESEEPAQEDYFEGKKKKKSFMFPHWMLYIAWIVCGLGIIVPAFFTVLYSMEWGRKKSLDWLSTFVLSFFQSVVVVQPIKVLLLAAFISCVIKKPEVDDEEATFDECHSAPTKESGGYMADVDGIELQDIVARRKKAATEMPDVDLKALEAARETRMKEIQMEAILKECIIYFFFVTVVFFLSYQTRDMNSYTFAENIKNTFVDTSPAFSSIIGPAHYWKYIHSVFLPNVYSSNWYNGKDLTWREKLQIDDRYTIRVGVPRMRLQKIKDDTCKIQEPMDEFINHCRSPYNWVDDDTADYLPGWIPITDENQRERGIIDCYADAFDGNDTSLKDEPSPWKYRTSIELKNAPYAGTLGAYKGGGYTFSFKRNYKKTKRLLEELERHEFIDVKARAVFLEFTLFNANINLFASCIFLVEYMATGAALQKTDIKVFRLASYVGGFGVIVLLMEIIYLCFIIYFFISELNKIRKQRLKYFKEFWNLLEFATLCMSITAIAMYAMKKIFGSVAMTALKESESGEYVNFVTISIWDELFGFILACVVFFTTIKFIKMLKFNRRMGMLGDTIKLATKDLKIFSITFFIYFFAFCMLAYAIFGTQLSTYGSFIGTAETLFAFALGDFDFYALQDAARIMGPIFFFLYVGIIYIAMMGMFLTIIAESFATVKENSDLQSNDYEIVDFIMKKVKGVFGWS